MASGLIDNETIDFGGQSIERSLSLALVFWALRLCHRREKKETRAGLAEEVVTFC